MRGFLWLTLLLLLPGAAHAQAARILLDGLPDDWQALAPLHADPSGDAPAGAVDFGRLWMAHDEQFFFLRFELGAEVLIQEFNEIVLYLDTDDDPATGQAVHGIGAELRWAFGQREGVFTAGGVSQDVAHSALGLVTAPTVSSTAFEVALARDALPDGQTPLLPGARLRLVLEDVAGGDRLPDAPGGVAFAFDDAAVLPPLPLIALDRQAEGDVRILTYNVERDALFDAARQPAFVRLLRAVAPDVIGFQEILAHSAEQTAAVVAGALPLPPGQTWHAARLGLDLVVVSRFPIRRSFAIDDAGQGRGSAAFLLDVQAAWGRDLLLLVAHPPCCRNDEARQLELDALMAFVRDARAAGGVLDLPAETPLVIVGDMNLVGAVAQLNTLLHGAIVNTGRFGPSFDPDWDGTALADLMPRSVALPMTFTWYRQSSAFHPGRLDFIVYTDSVLEPGNRFVLFTPAMPPDALAAYGLQPGDATFASDHLPLVGDFRLAGATGTAAEAPGAAGAALGVQGYPNPFRAGATLRFVLPEASRVGVRVYDARGRAVRVLAEGFLPAGEHRLAWDGRDARGVAVAPGLYFCRIETGGAAQTRALVRLR